MERDLRWQVGQKLAVGFPGTEVPQALRELVAEYSCFTRTFSPVPSL